MILFWASFLSVSYALDCASITVGTNAYEPDVLKNDQVASAWSYSNNTAQIPENESEFLLFISTKDMTLGDFKCIDTEQSSGCSDRIYTSIIQSNTINEAFPSFNVFSVLQVCQDTGIFRMEATLSLNGCKSHTIYWVKHCGATDEPLKGLTIKLDNSEIVKDGELVATGKLEISQNDIVLGLTLDGDPLEIPIPIVYSGKQALSVTIVSSNNSTLELGGTPIEIRINNQCLSQGAHEMAVYLKLPYYKDIALSFTRDCTELTAESPSAFWFYFTVFAVISILFIGYKYSHGARGSALFPFSSAVSSFYHSLRGMFSSPPSHQLRASELHSFSSESDAKFPISSNSTYGAV